MSNRNASILIPRELNKDSPTCNICHMGIDTISNHLTCYKTHESVDLTHLCEHISFVTATILYATLVTLQIAPSLMLTKKRRPLQKTTTRKDALNFRHNTDVGICHSSGFLQ